MNVVKKMEDDTKDDQKVMQTYMYDVTYLYQASHEMDSGKQCRPRSDATERDVRSGCILFAFRYGILIKHDNSKI